MERFSPELRLALALLSSDPARRARDSLRSIVGPDFDWPAFTRLVLRRHGIGPLIWQRLRELREFPMPEPARAELKAHYRANIQVYLMQKAQIVRLQRAFAAAGIEPILVKGIATADRFYAGGSLREVGDIDVVVNPAMIGRCDEAIGGMGYHRAKPGEKLGRFRTKCYSIFLKHFVYENQGGPSIELHWRFAQHRMLLQPDFYDELDGTEHLPLTGAHAVRVLAPLANFVHLTVHGAEHAWAKLKWLADLSPTMAALDDEALARIVAFGRRNALLPTLLLGFKLARDLLDVERAPVWIRELERAAAVRRLAVGSIAALQQQRPPWMTWAGAPAPYLRQFRHELRLSSSMMYRADRLVLFPFYYWSLTRPWSWFPRGSG